MPIPEQIATADDVRAFLLEVLEELGWAFHPDTPFTEYIRTDTGNPSYTAEEASRRDRLIEQAFDLMGDNLYDFALATAYDWAGIRFDTGVGSLVYCDTREPIRGFHRPGERPDP